MVGVQSVDIRLNGDHGLAPQVNDVRNLRVQLVHREERREVGGVGVGEDEHEERVGSGDDAGGERVDLEHIDGEGVRDAVPEGLCDAVQDVESAAISCVCRPANAIFSHFEWL